MQNQKQIVEWVMSSLRRAPNCPCDIEGSLLFAQKPIKHNKSLIEQQARKTVLWSFSNSTKKKDSPVILMSE